MCIKTDKSTKKICVLWAVLKHLLKFSGISRFGPRCVLETLDAKRFLRLLVSLVVFVIETGLHIHRHDRVHLEARLVQLFQQIRVVEAFDEMVVVKDIHVFWSPDHLVNRIFIHFIDPASADVVSGFGM